MPVPSTITDLSDSAASNFPQDSDSTGSTVASLPRNLSAIIKKQFIRGSDVAVVSSGSVTLNAEYSYFVVTGSGYNITGFSDAYNGRKVTLKFSGALTLVHSASLVLPSAANITTAAGDVFEFVNESSGVWRCTFNYSFVSAGLALKANIADLANTSDIAKGDAMIGFKQSGTGAVGITVHDKLREFISVKDFGAVGDGSTDDTSAIQAALTYITSQTTAGATTSGALTTSYSGNTPRLHIPKGTYKITSALTLGSYLEVEGDQAIIKQYTDTADIFVCDAYQLRIMGVQFVGGRYQISFYNQNTNSTMVAIENCQFFLSRNYAINSYSSHATYTHLSTDLSIYKCRFIACNKVLNNCCDSAVIDNCWIQVDKVNFTASSAAIQNKGASVADPDALTRLHIRDSFMIPAIGVEGVDRINNARWIDNYGSFSATHTRFGGEDAGMAILFHLGAPNTTYPWITTEAIFTECTLYAGPDARSDSCVVGIQGQIPNRVVIRNCTGPVGKPYIANLSSTNIPTYMTAYETATSRKAYDWFKIDITDAIHDINMYAGRSIIPNDLYKYAVKGRQTRIRRAAAQSIPNAFANTQVSFDTIDFDNVGAFDIANPTRIVMPNGCYKMRIVASVQMAVDAATKTLAVTIVTSAISRLAGDTSLRGINADSDRVCIEADVEGAPGSYWHINIQHNAAAALNLLDCRVSVTPLDFVG